MSVMDPQDSTPRAPTAPVTEADLHAYVDAHLAPGRRLEVESYLATRPDEQDRVLAWQRQKELLHRAYDPVLEEPVPLRFSRRRAASAISWQGLAASVAFAIVCAATAWSVRGAIDRAEPSALRDSSGPPAVGPGAERAAGHGLPEFARRAAVAHAVYSPEVRRPVEVSADQEQQLVTWLSKRLGTPIKVPALKDIGYELIGGRLLPGESGPVAQLMYHDGSGRRLTLYVTLEAPRPGGKAQTAFQFGQDGAVNVFYWVDRNFGYAISGAADRQELMRVAQEVYRQLER